MPQGSGVALLRSVEYFGGNGALTPIVTLAIWGAAGCALAVIAVLAPGRGRIIVPVMTATASAGLDETEPYYDLGSYHRPIDTPSPQAQVWFDRGMVWAYAFNHEESIRCFERALALDPGPRHRAMGHRLRDRARTTTRPGRRSTPSTSRRRWPGPGWNSGWPPTGRASVVERGLIDALTARFPTDDPPTPRR